MRTMLRSLKKNNRGSAIVLVIVALAFVGILAGTIMWMSLANFQMKATDQASKVSFYSAETVFEQIVAGLQGASSQATANAYRKVMQNYASEAASAEKDGERKSRFIKYYKEELVNILHDPGSSGLYDESIIRGYLDSGLQTRLDPTNPVEGNSLTMSGVMDVTGDNYDYITLRGFALKFTDDKGYYSEIETDIMMTAPDISFTMSSTLPDIFKYALIADDKLIRSTGGVSKVNGSIYAGEEGLTLNAGAMNINNADYVISMGPVVVKDAGGKLNIAHTDSNVKTQFWAKDIDITSSDRKTVKGGSLDVNGDIYVEDDLTIESGKSKVKLTGKYKGYGNSETEAAKSSAIMVNNLESEIDLSGLSDLTLAGYSFISLEKYYTDPATAQLYSQLADQSKVSANDIRMGESIAVKSDQVAFLVPEECVWVTKDKKTTTMSQNPCIYGDGTEITQLINKYCGGDVNKVYRNQDPTYKGRSTDPYELFNVMFDKELSNGKTLSDYVNDISDISSVFNSKSGTVVVYYYMKMSVDKAADFIQSYYKDNADKMKNYMAVYSSQLNLPVIVNTQGAYLAGEIAGVDTDDTNRMNGPNIKDATKKQKLSDDIVSYKAIISSLTTKLKEAGYVNPTIETNNPQSQVFDNLIDISKINNFLVSAGTTAKFTLDDGYNAIVTKASNYEYNGDNKCRLIISTGDVTIKGDFTGVIFAKGNIDIASDCEVTSIVRAAVPDDARSELVRVLQCPFNTSGTAIGNTQPLDFFRDGTSYVLAGTNVSPRDTSGLTSNKVDVLSTVNYKNWIKK
ncbi:MAG: hypothetical protein K6E98_13350 [Lachnospiraceae bacterium]|nr:hypothetical protein [Lachnospiraceae bacterium]